MQGNNKILEFSTSEFAEYKINIEQRFVINGKLFVNSITDIEWLYKIEENIDNPIISIETKSTKASNNPLGFDNLVKFAELFNKPTEKIVLELASSGEIAKVTNQKEILEKWEQMVSNELAEYKDDESMQGIFVAGYNDFSDTIKSLVTNPLYLFFFDGIYNQTFETAVRNKTNVNLLSRLFQGNEINLKNRQEAINFDTKVVSKNVYRYFSDDNPNLDLADLYQRNYKDIIGPEFDYKFECDSEAEYDIYRGLLNNLKAVCLEKANDNLFYETKYKINRAE